MRLMVADNLSAGFDHGLEVVRHSQLALLSCLSAVLSLRRQIQSLEALSRKLASWRSKLIGGVGRLPRCSLMCGAAQAVT